MDRKIVGSTLTVALNHFHYACRDHASGFAVAAVIGANTPLFGATDALGVAEVVTGIRGASACCR
jgi:hypothetical protein